MKKFKEVGVEEAQVTAQDGFGQLAVVQCQDVANDQVIRCDDVVVPFGRIVNHIATVAEQLELDLLVQVGQ